MALGDDRAMMPREGCLCQFISLLRQNQSPKLRDSFFLCRNKVADELVKEYAVSCWPSILKPLAFHRQTALNPVLWTLGLWIPFDI